MILAESFRMAVSNLLQHKARSVLTILGILIGLGAVLAVVTLGRSFEASVTSQFDSVDDRTIFIQAIRQTAGPGPGGGQQGAGPYGTIFTEVDRDRLEGLDGVDRVTVAGSVQVAGFAVGSRELVFDRLTATLPDAETVRKPADYESGRVFALGTTEIVLGYDIAVQLGPGTGPLVAPAEAVISFRDGTTEAATIVGVLKPDTAFFGSRNTQVYAPVDPYYSNVRPSPTTGEDVRVYTSMSVIAADARQVGDVQARVKTYMDTESDAHQLLAQGVSIRVATAKDLQASIGSLFDQITLFIGAIGAISLLVGAIGIANIMLVTVAERTREIGILKAIGAKNSEVMVLFLLEALLIGFFGAIFGIAAGLTAGALIVRNAFATTPVIPYDWIGLAILVGMGVGVVAGLLPARRATKVEVVRALAYE